MKAVVFDLVYDICRDKECGCNPPDLETAINKVADFAANNGLFGTIRRYEVDDETGEIGDKMKVPLVLECNLKVVEILKQRFPNLTATEVAQIAATIMTEICELSGMD